MLAEDPGEELCPHQWVSGRPQFKVIFPFGFTCGACSFLPGAEDQSPVLKVNLRNQFIHIPLQWTGSLAPEPRQAGEFWMGLSLAQVLCRGHRSEGSARR